MSLADLAELLCGVVVMPLAMVWSVASRPSLALLRAGKLCPPPVNLSAAEEDLSGRVIIVTGANTGSRPGRTTVCLFAVSLLPYTVVYAGVCVTWRSSLINMNHGVCTTGW